MRKSAGFCIDQSALQSALITWTYDTPSKEVFCIVRLCRATRRTLALGKAAWFRPLTFQFSRRSLSKAGAPAVFIGTAGPTYPIMGPCAAAHNARGWRGRG